MTECRSHFNREYEFKEEWKCIILLINIFYKIFQIPYERLPLETVDCQRRCENHEFRKEVPKKRGGTYLTSIHNNLKVTEGW